jgi:pimeloyl-ACP methyl ester carboxylesterase
LFDVNLVFSQFRAFVVKKNIHHENTKIKRMKMVVQVVLGSFFLYVGYCVILFLFQRSILFPRFQTERTPVTDKDIPGLEKIWIETRLGKVEAWYLAPVTERAGRPVPVVVFAHGNAERIDFWPEELNPFRAFGMGVFLVEYPGYGRSAGTPSQRNVTEAFVAAYDHLVGKPSVDASRIVLFGRSLGGGVACALARERPAAALILLSTFTSVRACAIKFLAPGFLVRDPFDNLDFLGSFSGPVLIMHGKRDRLVPYEHGVALSRTAKQARLVTYDCQHNDCPPSWKSFWRDVESFLSDAGII